MSEGLFIGLSSGASRDGVDAVLVNFTRGSIDLLHARHHPHPVAVRQALNQLCETGQPPTARLTSLLDESLGRFFARIAQDLVREAGMEMRDVRAIGSNGHNVWYTPDGDKPANIHLGDGRLMAKNGGTTVVTGFCNADIAAGGRGAPLTPLLHRQLFYTEAEDRVVVSINGISSLTLLPASGQVEASDCGPGLCLMDAWAMSHLYESRDETGKWAAKGTVHVHLLENMLRDPCLDQARAESIPPGYFNLSWLDARLAKSGLAGNETAPADVQATLTELTALAIQRRLVTNPLPGRLLVCGDGAHNRFLLGRIAAALPDVVVNTTAKHGADPDWVESLLFAWLARERIAGREQDTTSITGAGQTVLLGDIFEP